MADEKDVKQVEADTTTESTEENEQDSNDSEVVETQESEEVEKAKRLAENYKRAMQQERERRKVAEAQIRPQPVQTQVSEDDTFKRFLRTEADAKVARLMATDPTFKDRLDMVEEFVEKGYDITTADMMAKAKIMDLISVEAKKQEETEQKLTNLKSKASAEEESVPPPNYKDLLAGKFDDNPEAKMVREAMERFK